MLRTQIIDVEVAGELKPIEFYLVNAISYYLGWRSTYLKKLEDAGMFPRTPYTRPNPFGYKRPIRLFTRTQLVEVVELVENYYPINYSGRDPLKKEVYAQQKLAFSQRVKALQEKWNKED